MANTRYLLCANRPKGSGATPHTPTANPREYKCECGRVRRVKDPRGRLTPLCTVCGYDRANTPCGTCSFCGHTPRA